MKIIQFPSKSKPSPPTWLLQLNRVNQLLDQAIQQRATSRRTKPTVLPPALGISNLVDLDVPPKQGSHQPLDGEAGTTPHSPQLAHLRQVFGLTDQDIDLLLLALAPQFSANYGQIYGYLNGHPNQSYLMVQTALKVLCPSAAERVAVQARLVAPAPLVRYALVNVSAQKAADDLQKHLIQPSPSLIRWLLHGALFTQNHRVRGFKRLPTTEQPLLATTTKQRIQQVQQVVSRGTMGVLVGGSVGLREGAALAMASALGRDVVQVDLEQVAKSWRDAPAGVVRDLCLANAMPYVVNVPSPGAEPAERERVSALIEALADTPGPLCVGGLDLKEVAPLLDCDLQRVTIRVDRPAYRTRLAAWEHALHDHGIEPDHAYDLARRFHTLGGVRLVQALEAAHHQAGGQVPDITQVWAACRDVSKPKSLDLIEVITPKYTLDDIVLPKAVTEQLHLLMAHVEHQELVFQEWGAARSRPRGRGMRAVFVGGPGTGKTMCAEVLAGALGIALLKVDLSQMVSKWVGETQKHLKQVFDAAEGSNAMLLFDEGDALFSSRSDTKTAQDKYANQEVSYLLQRLETFEGAAIVTTNMVDNIDTAFLRRFGAVIHFPKPGREDMRRLWKHAIPKEAPIAADVDLVWLAQHFYLSGGLIVNAAINACMQAANESCALGQRHLLLAIAGELDKQGDQLSRYNFGEYTDLVLSMYRQ